MLDYRRAVLSNPAPWRRMIELQHLTKQYGEQVAVRDLSLRVDEGELLVLLGGSGSGKTTTLKMINRLIEPSAGSVRVDGRDVAELAPHDLRRRIGYAFQQVGLFPHMTVAENIGVTPVPPKAGTSTRLKLAPMVPTCSWRPRPSTLTPVDWTGPSLFLNRSSPWSRQMWQPGRQLERHTNS